MSNFKLNLIKSSNILGISFYTGSIRISDLCENMEIAEFKPGVTPLDGYQRKASDVRRSQLSKRIIEDNKKGDGLDAFVDSLNINIRASNAEVYCKPLDKNHDEPGAVYVFEYTDALKSPLYVVDGQHRTKGLQDALSKLLNDKELNDLNNLRDQYISINLIFTDDIYKEAYVFYLINEHAKSVPPDGATRLMVEGYKNNNVNFTNEVTGGLSKVNEDSVFSAMIADKLNQSSSIWASRIKDYNEAGSGMVSVRAMANMIKPLFLLADKTIKSSSLKTKATDLTYDIIEASWSGLEKVFPAMFTDAGKKQYNITKSSQAEVIMRVIAGIYSLQGEWHKHNVKIGDIKSAKTWENIFKHLKKFELENQMNQKVKGEQNWQIGKFGSMGIYTSAAAKKEIKERILNHIEIKLGIRRVNPYTV